MPCPLERDLNKGVTLMPHDLENLAFFYGADLMRFGVCHCCQYDWKLEGGDELLGLDKVSWFPGQGPIDGVMVSWFLVFFHSVFVAVKP